jgi:hypothetical protein
MLKPQSTVDPQLPSTKAKRHCQFDIFTTPELVAHRARELEVESILNKPIPRRPAYAQTGSRKVVERRGHLIQIAFGENRLRLVKIVKPSGRRNFACGIANAADGAQTGF